MMGGILKLKDEDKILLIFLKKDGNLRKCLEWINNFDAFIVGSL